MIKFGAKFNVHPALSVEADYVKLKGLILECEGLGFDSAWVMDHFFWKEGGLLECWTVLAALAAETHRIRLGPLVTCVSYRYPSLLAKIAATLDVISGGRLDFGIGAGWKEDEYRAYGVPFHSYKVRVRRLREAIIITKRMWTEDAPSFKGEFFGIKAAVCEPKPVQEPHPPIWIGGAGRPVLKVVAELGDACNFFGSPEGFKEKSGVLKTFCERAGRKYEDVVKTWTGDVVVGESRGEVLDKASRFKPPQVPMEEYLANHIVGTPEECISKIEHYAKLGVTHFLASMRTLDGDQKLFKDDVMAAFR